MAVNTRRRKSSPPRWTAWGLACSLCLAGTANAAAPTATQALQLAPIQAEVDYQRPTPEEAENCKIQPLSGNAAGWQVAAENGQLLRRFIDSNGDNKVDLWCYYRNGIEVYRDIDSNFNGKADQYRWLGTAGIRWGLDANEDGEIDRWKVISPEEVTAEVVEAIRTADQKRFQRLLLPAKTLETLGLEAPFQADLAKRIEAAESGFGGMARTQTTITQDSRWIHFGGTRPGVISPGTGAAQRDVYVYDNVTAVVETAKQPAQIHVGTLLRDGDAWFVVDLPRALEGDELAGGAGLLSLVGTGSLRGDASEAPADNLSEEAQALARKLQELEQQLQSATAAERAKIHAQRVETLEQLVDAAKSPEDREMWIRTLGDTVSVAVQSGEFQDGVALLRKWVSKLSRSGGEKNQIAYLQFHAMSANYSLQLADPKADFAKIQTEWLKQLKAFVELYPASDNAVEAMLQLAMAEEFAGEERAALDWYERIIKDFPDHLIARKAAGAKRRLESTGKRIALQGTTLDGRSLDLDRYRGKTVLIHYWATWCEPCKEEMKLIRASLAKYNRDGLEVIGVNLDTEPAPPQEHIRQNAISWPQVHESEGLDGRLAVELGILSLPTMILVDKEGRVVNRGMHARELDAELGKLLR